MSNSSTTPDHNHPSNIKKCNWNVFYECPITNFSDIQCKEEDLYSSCYDSASKPQFVKKTSEEIFESCSKQHLAFFIMIENVIVTGKEMRDFYEQIKEFLSKNYPNYYFEQNTFLNEKCNVWFTRLTINLEYS
jgi:hypothetical protein